MASKNHPGQFDCYANAEPDEPMFVLLGRDRDAPSIVERWADIREANGEDTAKVAEARTCAQSMRAWLAKLGKEERPSPAHDPVCCGDCGYPVYPVDECRCCMCVCYCGSPDGYCSCRPDSHCYEHVGTPPHERNER